MSIGPWLETGGVVALACAGTFAGLRTTRLPHPYWLLGVGVSLTFFAAFAVIRWIPSVAFLPPFAWLTHERREFAIAAFMIPYAFATLVPRLARRRERVFVTVGAALVVCGVCVTPFLLPAMLHGTFAAMTTHINSSGVCIQNTGYTCGPAAAVTALRSLGLPAEEGELAILAHTSPIGGTDPLTLATVLGERYRGAGLTTAYRCFESIDELRAAGLTIAVVKLDFLIDHYVVVFAVADAKVRVGDPLGGMRTLPRAQFEERWRRTGIVLARPEAARKE
jgi:hypothetical protein